MKRTAFLIVGLLSLFFCPLVVQAASDGPSVSEQLAQLDVSDIRRYWETIVSEYGGFLPESEKGPLTDFLSGDKQWSPAEWLKALARYLFYELQVNGKLLGTLILLAVFSTVLQSLQNAFAQQEVSKIAQAVVYMVLLLIALNSFRLAADYALEAVRTMSHFIIALVPLLLALLATSGGVASAAFFHPIILFVMNTTGTVVEYVTLPLLLLAALLSVVSTLSDRYKATQLADLLNKASLGLLGLILTVFLGVMSVRGATAAVADGVALRAAKFVTGNFIPVVGKLFTDAADTVVAASMLLKNTVGLVGAAILLMIAIFPAVKIFAIVIVYKLSAALLQPLGGGPVLSCLNIIGKSIAYVLAALLIVSLMFFLSLTVMVMAGNITMMVR
ncbi:MULTISPECIES: stage III sporulation protein AE [Geobacillus]|uniref:Stage III sporulation protein AE n=4 Tax=Geobacillus thermoleovorans group TaxID=1505648 RepID=Q5KX97_GEOKA|nr:MULTISPECIES: stage III sporulation protein AE [Geobacillus]AMV11579.1 stage III sporulation protein AE [Geobacillus thermoleovorans]AUI37900.1 stage III sporulation protein AE [[Bacillus] caldolyticus]AWO75462.1 stage III sporulation protein AE [Geobacillus thermoleovorans]EQB95093.1 stage III sporulation protein AE [Geobacillus sp. A8]KDE47602.1 stage III sporulation protein AE [Geobacillus sp. CAMR5420]